MNCLTVSFAWSPREYSGSCMELKMCLLQFSEILTDTWKGFLASPMDEPSLACASFLSILQDNGIPLEDDFPVEFI